jgi:hypothetical protein
LGEIRIATILLKKCEFLQESNESRKPHDLFQKNIKMARNYRLVAESAFSGSMVHCRHLGRPKSVYSKRSEPLTATQNLTGANTMTEFAQL